MAGNKAIFLDRDGILIKELGNYCYRDEDIEIVEGVVEALQELKKKGYIFIVITNQGGIARGLYSHKRLNEIHADLREFFASFGIKILEFYYCPHHPETSNCLCRKPDSLMLEKAIAKYKVNPDLSYFIGDNIRDIEAGAKARVKTLLVESNADLREHLYQIE